jgi:hypothetical protein
LASEDSKDERSQGKKKNKTVHRPNPQLIPSLAGSSAQTVTRSGRVAKKTQKVLESAGQSMPTRGCE